MKIIKLTPAISMPHFSHNETRNIKEAHKHQTAAKLTRLLKAPVITGIAFGIIATGCAAVHPWERGNLAKEHMALDPNPGQTMYREHIYGSREGSSGGSTGKGGGCGCY